MSTPIGWRHKETGALVSNDRMAAMRKDNPHFDPGAAGYTNDVYAGLPPHAAYARSTESANLHTTLGGNALRLFGREFVAEDLMRLVHARTGDVFRLHEDRDVARLDLISGPSRGFMRTQVEEYRSRAQSELMRRWVDEVHPLMRVPELHGVFPQPHPAYRSPLTTGRILADDSAPQVSTLTAEAQHLRELLRTPTAVRRENGSISTVAPSPNEPLPDRNET